MSGGRFSGIECVALLICAAVASLGTVILFCFDPTQYHFYPTCIFHQATGLLCPGCGCLRALHQLLHGHWVNAFRFNPLLVMSLPLVASLAVVYAARNHPQEAERLFITPRWLWVMVLIFLGVSIWRNLPGAPTLITPP